ncbi:hypothetical protein M436DRAFT_79241 [Aureobasidium namibiae CBS 147.97]|uniref:Uncharacterized protein n=1 Tax=Aureobasidium namibiae CBS 147.97 TaxID=1043004 RepID=A0A074WWQ6_9PEZI
MAASAMRGRLALSDPSVKELAQASCAHESYYNTLPKLEGEANWQQWSDALQHAALMAGTDTVLNGEAKHPQSLEGKQYTTTERNDNVKRTAIWRARNESLLKAMRSAADIDLTDLGASNAHDTYVSLRSRYHASDDQRAFRLFSEDLITEYEFDHSPEEFAYGLQDAFNQYNQLVGDDVEQRLPENFLKMALLVSLGSAYHDWCKALLRERDVLALGHGSTVTFDELVELAIVEHTRLLQEQARGSASTSAPLSQQAPKRNISLVEEPARLDLHKPCSVPHHSNGDHTNQVCMVQNPRLRFLGWKPSKADEMWLAEHPDIEYLQVGNITQHTATAQPDLRRPCSLPDHVQMKHTDQACWTQNPQMRRRSWRPSEADQRYLAEHPEIEDPQLRNISLRSFDDVSEDASKDESENRSDNYPDEESEHDSENSYDDGSECDVERDSEHEDASEQETFARDQDDTPTAKDFNDINSEDLPQADGAWEQFAAARFAEVQAQIDLVARAVDGCQNFGKKVHKNAPLVGDLSGQWVLYNKGLVSSTVDHYTIELWENTTNKQKQMHPTTRRYRGKLSIKSHGHSTTFTIPNILPHSRVSGHPLSVVFRQSKNIYAGKLTFWGRGKMIISIPPSVLGEADCNDSRFVFAGLRSDTVVNSSAAEAQAHMGGSDESRDNEAGAITRNQPAERVERNGRAEATGEYDRVIRTEPSTVVTVKDEKGDSDVIMNNDDQPVVIKAEEPETIASNDELDDDVAAIIDTVQKQENMVKQGTNKRLQQLGGEWRFHSAKHNPDLGGGISLSFSIRQNHDIPDQMCAPGHCKAMPTHSDRYPRRIFYCGELHLKGEEGKPDLDYLIRQFDLPKRASPVHITILLENRSDQDTICMHTWFFGDGTMRIELPTAKIPGYRGEDAWISFSGLQCDRPTGV